MVGGGCSWWVGAVLVAVVVVFGVVGWMFGWLVVDRQVGRPVGRFAPGDGGRAYGLFGVWWGSGHRRC